SDFPGIGVRARLGRGRLAVLERPLAALACPVALDPRRDVGGLWSPAVDDVLDRRFAPAGDGADPSSAWHPARPRLAIPLPRRLGRRASSLAILAQGTGRIHIHGGGLSGALAIAGLAEQARGPATP